MRPPRNAIALARLRSRAPTETLLDEDLVQRIEQSCPGDTFMPPACVDAPAVVVERWVAEAELTGEKDPYLGKRRHPRFTWSVVVLIRVRSGRLAGKIIRARARNISLGGMGILIRSELELGTIVEISIEGRRFSVGATVMHCTKAMTGNLLGVCFGSPE